jgi:hypothetical protein
MMTQSKRSHNYPVVELLHNQHKRAERIDIRLGQADLGRTAIQAVMGGRAFRSYGAFSNTIGVNKAGNLRGMVVSAKWQTMSRHTSEVGEYLENIGYLAAIASGIIESAPKFEAILGSSDSTGIKGAKITARA